MVSNCFTARFVFCFLILVPTFGSYSLKEVEAFMTFSPMCETSPFPDKVVQTDKTCSFDQKNIHRKLEKSIGRFFFSPLCGCVCFLHAHYCQSLCVSGCALENGL